MRRSLFVVPIAFLLAIASPARAQFCPGVSPWVFDDVAASDPFCGYITWMAENGITLGCQIVDANHRLYCPNANVSRAAMAAFMNRLGNVRVEAVDTGPGLTGGPITGIGTINLATTQLLPTTACANNQIPRWNGTAWACSADTNSGGTVTSITAGNGLTGGTITSSGTINLATTQLLPTTACATNQIPKWNGSVWTCAADANSGGTVTSVTAGAGLTGGTITTSGTIAVDPASATLTGNFFKQGGNAFGATAVLGTTDNNAIDILANNSRVVRYEPDAISPNVIGGSPANNVTVGVRGGTIGGGGLPTGNADPDFTGEAPNRVTDAYGTVGGGYANRAGDDAGTTIDRPFATVGGGLSNTASGGGSTIGGGIYNTASGTYGTVGGGIFNTASGGAATVPGGGLNVASGLYSFAAGRRAKALADGAFILSDSTDADFTGSTPNVFAAGFTGGIGMWTTKNFTMGCSLAPGGGSWSCISSRDQKQDFVPVDAQAVLQRVALLPISEWRYRTEVSGAWHVGPMAQDFHAAFGLGDSEKTIGLLDASGVALAAIQGLNAKLEATIAEQSREIGILREEVQSARALAADVVALKSALAALQRQRSDLALR
ncbi:MAG: hypothetical protein U1F41_03880 [Burkholderiales bacterium]